MDRVPRLGDALFESMLNSIDELASKSGGFWDKNITGIFMTHTNSPRSSVNTGVGFRALVMIFIAISLRVMHHI